jgi:large subunit ribosomal protein L29
MKSAEIKGLNLAELKEKLGGEQETLRKLKFAHKVSAIENPMKIREVRKLIAKLKTEVTVKEKVK